MHALMTKVIQATPQDAHSATVTSTNTSRHVTFGPTVDAYPTEAREQQKLAAAQAKASGIVVPTKKKKFVIEQHHDDCGESLAGLGIDEAYFCESDSDNVLSDDEATSCITTPDVDFTYLSCWSLHGTEHNVFCHQPQHVFIMSSVEEICLLASRTGGTWRDDIVEVCGGEHRITTVAVRKRMHTGSRWDLCTGTDLTDPREAMHLKRYLATHKPRIVILQPPCTPFGPWANFNKSQHYSSWKESYDACAPVARLCGECAELQLSNNCDWLVEQPMPSQLFQEHPWPRLAMHPKTRQQIMDRCMTNQKNANGNFVRKRTQLWASSELLLAPFVNLLCNGSHNHEQVTGSATEATKVYTWEFAERIVLGCQLLIRNKYPKTHNASAYPSVASGPRDADAEVQPSATDEAWRKCYGCRNRKRVDDDRHTRIEGECKHPFVTAVTWNCPGCKAGAVRSDLRHVLDATCRWCAASVRPRNVTAARQPDEPRIPVHSEPTADIKVSELGHEDEPVSTSSSSIDRSNIPVVPASARDTAIIPVVPPDASSSQIQPLLQLPSSRLELLDTRTARPLIVTCQRSNTNIHE